MIWRAPSRTKGSVPIAGAHGWRSPTRVPWRFSEKDVIAFSGQGRVPVLIDGDKTVSDSWAIAAYLEQAYPDRPSLFGGAAGHALARFINGWADAVVLPGIAGLIVADVYAHLHEKYRDYFRTSREQRLRQTLEAACADRDVRVGAFRQSLQPLRMKLAAQPWLGGDALQYADYIVFGCLRWARCISPFRLLEKDDPVATWRGRLLEAFDGLAGKAPGYS
jgi:glutathione S-transferase